MGVSETMSDVSHAKSAPAVAPRCRLAGADYYQRIFAQLNGSKELLRTLGVTSCTSHEGVSSVALGLADAAAAAGKNVLLVDANPDRPVLHRVYRLTDRPGLSEVLAERQALREAIHRTDTANLSLIPAGAKKTRLLAEADDAVCSGLLEAILAGFDFLVWDLPPVSNPAFPRRLAALLDGIVWVIAAGRISATMAAEMKQRMDNMHMHMLGIVLNRASRCVPLNGFAKR